MSEEIGSEIVWVGPRLRVSQQLLEPAGFKAGLTYSLCW